MSDIQKNTRDFNNEIIWDIIVNHLPKNKTDLEHIIKAEKI